MIGSRASSGVRDGASVLGWPERSNRTLIVLAVVAILVGTVALSMTMFSVPHRAETITVEPRSYHSLYLGAYGFCRLEYSHTGASYFAEGYIVELDRKNFELLADGKPYDYTGYEAIGMGGQGTMTTHGALWELFIVVVNEGSSPFSIEFEYDMTVYVSYLPAGPIALAVFACAYAVDRWMVSRGSREIPPALGTVPLTTKRRMIQVIVVLVLMPVALVYAFEILTPGSLSLWMSGFITLPLSLLISIVIALFLRFKLLLVQGSPEDVLADLAHRLRVSRYLVAPRRSYLSVQISSTAAIKLRAKRVPDGTLVSFQMDATPTGWVLIFIGIFLFVFFMPLAWAVVLFTLYRAAAFAQVRVIPRMSQMPIPSFQQREADAKAVLIDSLAEGRRLASEAYDSVKSNYEDSFIISVLAAMLVFAVLAVVSWFASSQFLEGPERIVVTIVVGAVGSVYLLVFQLIRLVMTTKPVLAEIKAWRGRLEGALFRETTVVGLADSGPSSFEVVLDSYRELPKWLKARSKGGAFRQPGLWFLMFFISYGIYGLALYGVFQLGTGNLPVGGLFFGVAMVLVYVVFALYLRWKRQQDEESKTVSDEWSGRYETLRSEMEAYLRGV